MKKITVLFCAFLLLGIITHAQSVSANITSNVSCNGGNNGAVSATASGGNTPYTYSWNPGGGTNTTETGLTAGTYSIILTDNHGRTATASTTITQPASALSVSATATYSAVCGGASDNLTASPSGGTIPYTYLWQSGAYNDIMSCPGCANNTVLVIPFANPYTVAVTDNNGCQSTATVNVGIYPFPHTTVTGCLNPVCPGNNDTLTVSAAGATSYLWSTGATTSSIIVNPVLVTKYR